MISCKEKTATKINTFNMSTSHELEHICWAKNNICVDIKLLTAEKE